MLNDFAIIANNISKKYKIYKTPKDRLKEALSITGRLYHDDFWALQNVTLKVKKGTTFGIMGVNGSGKSTLLKIVCGYLKSTSGNILTHGRVSSILELGTGFNAEFTGMENVILYAGIMGLTKNQISDKLPLIENFAEIGEFFYRPLRLYSSGMYSRLAFACNVHVEPEILIIDEALAVGDIAFQHKCMDRIRKLQEENVTILFVSHSIGAIKSLCKDAILLDNGIVIYQGKAEDVANYYHGILAKKEQDKITVCNKLENDLKKSNIQINDNKLRVGTGEITIKEVFITDSKQNRIKTVNFNQMVTVSVRIHAERNIQPAVVGFIIRDRFGVDLIGTNTAVENIELPIIKDDNDLIVDFSLKLPLLKGSYSVTSAVGQDPERPIFYDWLDNAFVFEVLPPYDRKIVNCKVHLPIRINLCT